ncbi:MULTISPECIES: hypothetical protein [unclassified Pedobacter]|uniref:hypothetical protein n=1 Tax=unclassified Pedobacter TaxID=2628915 RepID=UPI001423CC71|nr:MULTISPECIES: hypothetical protein [unclassified Pedobacter]NII81727.1 hypothetical protein [Pedobacter sp. SG908]NMN35731.1 hypothetical protein [Pedobacter sp. SG918]
MLSNQERNEQAYLSICSTLAMYTGSENPASYQSGVEMGLKIAKAAMESLGCIAPKEKEAADV